MSKIRFTSPHPEMSGIPGQLLLVDDNGDEHPVPFVKSVSMYVDIGSMLPVLKVELYKADVLVNATPEQVENITVSAEDGEPVQPVDSPYPIRIGDRDLTRS